MKAELGKSDEATSLRTPRHIAIIMDGNGRWARRRGLRRPFGHREGAESVREITRECARLGIGRLTLYAFSADNWKRPPSEVRLLMKLLRKYLIGERREILENNIRFEVIGRIGELPEEVREEIARTIDVSRDNTGMVLCLALNYGARGEIVDAVRRLGREIAEGRLDPDAITEEDVSCRLYAPAAPDPDLLIRTGGDLRLSNFLLWQASYTELWVTPLLWPEFRKEHLHSALKDFGRRERRFGGVAEE